MKFVKKLFPILLCAMMIVTALSVASFAADEEPNVSMVVSATEVDVGDTVTVTVSCNGMTVSSIGTYVKFDSDLLEITSIVSDDPEYPEYFGLYKVGGKGSVTWTEATAVSDVATAKTNSQVGFVYAGTSDATYQESVIFTATFNAKATGTVNFILVEDSEGADGFKDTATTTSLTIKAACNHTATSFVDNEDGTHSEVCTSCEAVIGDPADHTPEADDGNCATAIECSKCEAITTAAKEHFDGDDKNHDCDNCDIKNIEGHTPAEDDGDCTTDIKCTECDEVTTEGKADHSYTYDNNGANHTVGCDNANCEYSEPEDHDYGDDHVCICDAKFTGWEGKTYYKNAVMQTGWTKIGEDWYYLNTVTGVRAEGITRVPYPTVEIEGNTYACTEEGVTEDFVDYSEAWFIFGNDGKFLHNENGHTTHGDTIRFAVNGMIPWHYGFSYMPITDGESEYNDYYYFIGDKENGGNKLVTGDVRMTRTNGVLLEGKAPIDNGIYTFDENGILCLYEGVVKVGNDLRYYSEYCYNAKHGLIEVDVEGETKYIYVSSTTSKLVVNTEYWVANVNGLNIVAGAYTFDENGYMINPIDPDVYNGIVEIDGVLYYYVDGKKQAGAGVVEMTDDKDETFYIYVKSNGQLATDIYWPTNTNDLLDRGAYNWGEDGRYYPDAEPKEEIREDNGNLYYYVNGIKQIGSGVVEMTDDEGATFYIYVRSNGQLATDKYWPTNRNDLLPRGEYDWGKDGRYYPAD